jgi:methyl-accepting chemotaxis protein
MMLRHFTLRARFTAVISVITLVLVLFGVWGIVATHVGITRVEALFEQSRQNAEAVMRLRDSVAELRRLPLAAMAAGTNVNEVDRVVGEWQKAQQDAQRHAQALAAADPGLADQVRAQEQRLAEFTAAIGPILGQLKAAQIDASAAFAYAERQESKAQALVEGSSALVAAVQAAQDATRTRLAESMKLASNLRVALTALSLVLVVPLLWWTWVSVRDPLAQAVDLAGRIAGGDLSRAPEVHGRDETAALLRSLVGMQDGLRKLVSQVRGAAESIQVASAEVASGNHDLSQRTEAAAGSLQAAASSIEQLHGTVSQSAESARQADQLAQGASTVASRGGDVVAQVVSTMDGISQGSRRIADIIGTIDGIAFQTNILALNAAVEAARAGEQGRGFAVVAGEVRALAQRSAQAAREIKSLIGDSVARVESGTELVQQAGGTMGEIVDSVRRVTAMIGEITHAAQEQSSGIGQVNASVAELDRATQANAALVEQSAAAAESLKRQAEALNALVATFRLA